MKQHVIIFMIIDSRPYKASFNEREYNILLLSTMIA